MKRRLAKNKFRSWKVGKFGSWEVWKFGSWEDWEVGKIGRLGSLEVGKIGRLEDWKIGSWGVGVEELRRCNLIKRRLTKNNEVGKLGRRNLIIWYSKII